MFKFFCKAMLPEVLMIAINSTPEGNTDKSKAAFEGITTFFRGLLSKASATEVTRLGIATVDRLLS